MKMPWLGRLIPPRAPAIVYQSVIEDDDQGLIGHPTNPNARLSHDLIVEDGRVRSYCRKVDPGTEAQYTFLPRHLPDRCQRCKGMKERGAVR